MKGSFLFLVFGFLFILSGCGSDEPVYIDPLQINDKEATVLNFHNYLGNAENIHPKVLYFKTGWRGYKFWMAYTPYPKGETQVENPCIAVSNDGVNWKEVDKSVNPLALPPKNGYNSDTHLVYDKKNDQLEVWYRPYVDGRGECICRRVSSNGINWSMVDIVIEYGSIPELILSPAVWIEGDEYIMIYSNGLVLKTIKSPLTTKGWKWSEPETLPIDWKGYGLRAWHQDVILAEDGTRQMVVQAFEWGGNNNMSDLYYVEMSADGKNATQPKKIISRGDAGKYDERSIYRSSLVKVENTYYLYYSSIDKSWHRHMLLKSIPESAFSSL